MFTNNANLQQQPSQLRSNSNYQAGQYYDQSGYNPAGMSLYDPKRMQSHISTSSVGSKSSTMDQSASPITGSYYSLSLVNSHYSLSLVNSHQAQIGNYPTSFPHYHQTPTSNVEGAYHVMRSMSGSEMGNVVGMQSMDPNLRTRAAAAVPPPPYANTTQQDPGVYHQQYPTVRFILSDHYKRREVTNKYFFISIFRVKLVDMERSKPSIQMPLPLLDPIQERTRP